MTTELFFLKGENILFFKKKPFVRTRLLEDSVLPRLDGARGLEGKQKTHGRLADRLQKELWSHRDHTKCNVITSAENRLHNAEV